MRSLQVVVQELQDLQHTDAIAEFLQAEGIKGIPCETDKCPVARYAARETARTIDAGPYCVSTLDSETGLEQEQVSLLEKIAPGHNKLTPVARFISSFDARSYPELLEEVSA